MILFESADTTRVVLLEDIYFCMACTRLDAMPYGSRRARRN